MILTKTAIREAVEAGDITIDPFDPELLNPNSYNYRLGHTLKALTSAPADPRREPETTTVVLPPEGYVLQPRVVYLGNTVERIGSNERVSSLIGRSSVGRLGCFLQISADLGQLGAEHCWTLEITVVQPLRVYPGMRIGQVSFWRPTGDRMPYQGHYGRISDPAPWAPSPLPGAVAHAALTGQEVAA
ncbi:dCTP deaminase [Streptomyces sp. MT206]|uniref:dCTP deaminase n=1 Tax=Streptomyces sp. MT206 TaxID=3031407 RepID=UPI002FC74BF0